MAEGSIARTLRVLEAVCDSGPQTLKTLSERTNLAPPTLLRILRLMAEEGYVSQEADRTWRGTMLVWRLGYAVNSAVGTLDLSRQHTDALTAELDEAAVYAVYELGAVTYAARAEPMRPVRAHIRLGERHDLLEVTTGQAVLAHLGRPELDRALKQRRAAGDPHDPAAVKQSLATIRETGVAEGSGSRWPDLWGCAAAVFDAAGLPVGALGVAIPSARVEDVKDATIAAVVREAALMSAHLGHHAAASHT